MAHCLRIRASPIASTSQAMWNCCTPVRRAFATEVSPADLDVLKSSHSHPSGYVQIFEPRSGLPAPDSQPLPGETALQFRWRMAWLLNESLGNHYAHPRHVPVLSEAQLTPNVPWRPGMRRVGMVGKKQGSISMWDANGECHIISVVRLANNFVYKTEEHETHSRVYVSGGAGRASGLSLEQQRMFRSARVPMPAYFDSFKVHKDGVPALHTMLRAIHFVPGQWVDVKGTTRQHGFSGAMKRHGFAGGPASHGSTKFHRKIGAVSTRGLGTIKPGTRMAGHMGGLGKTSPCRVVRIDTELDLLYLKGVVPGQKDNWVSIQDAHLWHLTAEKNKHGILGLPWPCGSADMQQRLGDVPKEITLLEMGRKDPYHDISLASVYLLLELDDHLLESELHLDMEPRSVNKGKSVAPEPAMATEEPVDETIEAIEEPMEEEADPRVAKLKALQRRRQQAQLENRKDVRTEHNKHRQSAQENKRLERQRQKAMALEEKLEAEETGEDLERKRNWEYTIEDNEKWDKKQDRKKRRGQFEFTDFDDAARRKYKKDMDSFKPDLKSYNAQRKAIMGDEATADLDVATTGESQVVNRATEMLYRDANSFVYADHKPSEDAIDRMIGQLNADIDKRNKRSRQRKEDDGDVTYINDANKHFNKKLSRFFDKYTSEIKDSLEAGTATG